ncbi:MAG: ribonuclease H [Polyangiaceae bacterium]
MPWVRAKLRGQLIYARADAGGNLVAEGGRVEIRYKPNDGRMYRAAPGNLKVEPGEVLPDDACGPAEAVGPGKKTKKKASKKAAPKPAPVPDGAIIAYTDGACSGNPGPAGLGVVVLHEGERIERWEYLGKGTNNIAELTAILRALEEIPPGSPCVVHTDSQYAIGVLQKGWKAKKNKELIAELRATLTNHDCRLVYVKGHAGIPLNERADELARLAVEIRDSGRQASKEPS